MPDELPPTDDPNAHLEAPHIPVEGGEHGEQMQEVENLGEAAVASLDSASEDASGTSQDEFKRDTPNELYEEHRDTSRRLSYAKEQSDESDDRLQRHNSWLDRNFDKRGHTYLKKYAEKNRKNLERAQTDYDGNLAEAEHHIESIHDQANELVEAYANYGHIQQMLSESTESPVARARSITEFVDSSYGRATIDELGVYLALEDFFCPEASEGDHFNGYKPGRHGRLPRRDLGESANKILEEDDGGNEPLLKITEAYTPQISRGYGTHYETVVRPTEQQERYVRLTPEMQELFSVVAPQDLNFRTTLYSEASGFTSIGEIGENFEITDKEALRQAKEIDDNTPFKANFQYLTKGEYGEQAWQSVQIGTETESALREQVLTHLLDNMDLQVAIAVNGKRIDLKDFLVGKDEGKTAA